MHWASFRKGALDSLPLIVAAAPFGVLFGALAGTANIDHWVAVAMSAVVFAGSAQYVAIGMLIAGMPIYLIVLTTFIVNLRHLLYAFSLAPYFKHLERRSRMALAFFLTDETFVTVSQHSLATPRAASLPAYYFGSALFMYGNWQVCTWIGLWAGTSLSGIENLGLDFAMVAAFIGMLTPMLKHIGNVVSALVAMGLAWLTRDWPHRLGLIFALVAAALFAVIFEQVWKRVRHAY